MHIESQSCCCSTHTRFRRMPFSSGYFHAVGSLVSLFYIPGGPNSSLAQCHNALRSVSIWVQCPPPTRDTIYDITLACEGRFELLTPLRGSLRMHLFTSEHWATLSFQLNQSTFLCRFATRWRHDYLWFLDFWAN